MLRFGGTITLNNLVVYSPTILTSCFWAVSGVPTPSDFMESVPTHQCTNYESPFGSWRGRVFCAVAAPG